MAPALTLLLETGLREGELLALTWDKVIKTENHTYLKIDSSCRYDNVENRTQLIIGKTKNGKSRTIPLNETAERALEYYKKTNKDSNYIFANEYGNVPHSSTLRRSFDKVLKEANIKNVINNRNRRYKYCVHSLRHTFATNLVNGIKQPDGTIKSLTPRQVADLLGHSTSDITEMYYVKRNDDLLNGITNGFEI